MRADHPVLFRSRRVGWLALTAALAGLAAFSVRWELLPASPVPVIYVVQSYRGMEAAQIESYITRYHEQNFRRLSQVASIQSRSVQSAVLIQIIFQRGADMHRAESDLLNYAKDVQNVFPRNLSPPFIIRLDSGTEEIGRLSLHSATRSPTELRQLAGRGLRIPLAHLSHLVVPPVFGSAALAAVIDLDPRKLAALKISAEQIARLVVASHATEGSGNIRLGNLYPLVKVNSLVDDLRELENLPLRLGTYPTTFLRDVAHVYNGAEIPTYYALVDGQETVFLPLWKASGANAFAVAREIEGLLPTLQRDLPADVKLSFDFDRTAIVRRAISELGGELALGIFWAVLLLGVAFRSAEQPVRALTRIGLGIGFAGVWLAATAGAVSAYTLSGIALYACFALGGLALERDPLRPGSFSPGRLARLPLRYLLCLAATLAGLVVLPPEARALVAAIAAVPVVAGVGLLLLRWIGRHHGRPLPPRLRAPSPTRKSAPAAQRWRLPVYGAICTAVGALVLPRLHIQIAPRFTGDGLRLHGRAPAGTYVDQTEVLTRDALQTMGRTLGPELRHSCALAGTVVGNTSTNLVYAFSSGQHDIAIDLEITPGFDAVRTEERLRQALAERLPEVTFTFEPAGLAAPAFSAMAQHPVEIEVLGGNLENDRRVANRVRDALAAIPQLRDVRVRQVEDYPLVKVTLDRRDAGIKGFTADSVWRAVSSASAYWRQYQMLIRIPLNQFTSLDSLRKLPIGLGGGSVPLEHVAQVTPGVSWGEIDHRDGHRALTLTANVFGATVGDIAPRIERLVAQERRVAPAGTYLWLGGQIAPLHHLVHRFGWALAIALALAVTVLVAELRSVRTALAVASVLPAAAAGAALALWVSGTPLDAQAASGALLAMALCLMGPLSIVTLSGRGAPALKRHLRPLLVRGAVVLLVAFPLAAAPDAVGGLVAPFWRAVLGADAAATAATLWLAPCVFA